MKLPDYKLNQSNLICGFIFSPQGVGRPIEIQNIVTWFNQAQSDESDEFIWLHFDLSKATTQKWMQTNLNLPEVFFEALGEGSRSTRIENASDNLIAVINDVDFRFSFEPSEISTLWVNVNKKALISARTHPLRTIDQLRVSVKSGAEFNTAVSLLIHLFKNQCDVIVNIVRDVTLQVDNIEDSLLSNTVKSKRVDLGKLRRLLVRLKRLLAPEPSALFRLLHEPPKWIEQNDLLELRQATEEFALVIRDLSDLQERIKLLQEEITAQVGEQTNQSLFTLTIVTVLALPINIIAGLFGMNVGGIPLAQNSSGFPIIIAIVIAFTVIAGWLIFGKKSDD
jgi:zinc transporter